MLIALIIIVLLVVFVISLYNTLVQLRLKVKNACFLICYMLI